MTVVMMDDTVWSCYVAPNTEVLTIGLQPVSIAQDWSTIRRNFFGLVKVVPRVLGIA